MFITPDYHYYFISKKENLNMNAHYLSYVVSLLFNIQL